MFWYILLIRHLFCIVGIHQSRKVDLCVLCVHAFWEEVLWNLHQWGHNVTTAGELHLERHQSKTPETADVAATAWESNNLGQKLRKHDEKVLSELSAVICLKFLVPGTHPLKQPDTIFVWFHKFLVSRTNTNDLRPSLLQSSLPELVLQRPDAQMPPGPPPAQPVVPVWDPSLYA